MIYYGDMKLKAECCRWGDPVKHYCAVVKMISVGGRVAGSCAVRVAGLVVTLFFCLVVTFVFAYL